MKLSGPKSGKQERSSVGATRDARHAPTLLIGVDEAGLGPNLGPLVIAATAWRLPDAASDLYQLLADSVSTDAIEAPADRLVIADSKQLYHASESMALLESGVLALQTLRQALPQRSIDLIQQWQQTGRGNEDSLIAYDRFFDHYLEPVPVAAATSHVEVLQHRLRRDLQRQQIELVGIAARVVFPDEFNRLIESYDNKSLLLSACSLELVKSILSAHGGDALICCDRHGGRARYAPLMQQFLTPQFIWAISESSEISRYRWHDEQRQYEMTFSVGGESNLAVAAASMVAKYVRELLMRQWNAFWRKQIPTLRPTAGYPVDARRFRLEIADVQRRLEIKDDQIWRRR